MQHDYRYVSKNEAKKFKSQIEDLIHEVQNYLRDEFTFRYDFVGSYKRNMVTYDAKGNKGYDLDVNIEVNDDDENYSAEEIRRMFRLALDRYSRKYGFDYAEDSTRVITIKIKDRMDSRIVNSCDFAIVYNCKNGKQQYIRFNKEQRTYSWVYQGKGYYKIDKRIAWIKDNGLWDELLDYYIYKKNINTNPDKHSRAIFAESVNEIYSKYINRK